MIGLKERLFLWASALALAAAPMIAQSTTSLRGAITDANGGRVAGAVVTISNSKTGFTRQTNSGGTGEYQFLQIPPDTYEVKVEQQGFRVATQNGVVLQVNTPATLNLKLELGSVMETVNVTADVAVLNVVDASVGNAFTQQQVRQLPLLTRNVVELLSLQPGVTSSGEVLGAKRDQNNITLDGVDANDNQNAGVVAMSGQSVNGSNANGVPGTSGFNAALPVPLDSVQEFRVTVSGEGANQGHSSGGQVTLITKSGTNSFHGSAYEFNRNTATAANDWFSNRAGIKRQPLVRNQFGASLGGRIIRDRVFFFGNFENRRDASGQAVTRTVPSDTLRQGILTFRASDGSVQQLSPAEIKSLDPRGIGSSPTVLSIMSQYPRGNDPQAGADKGLNFSGFRFNAPFKENDKAYVAKMDFVITSNQTLAVRGTLAGNSQDAIVAQFPGQDPAARLLNNSRGLAAVYNNVLRSNLINTFTFGLTRVGLNQTGAVGAAYAFDTISSLNNYNSTARGYVRIAPVYIFADDLNWTKGRHTINAGVNVHLIRNSRSSYTNSFPAYSFSRNTLLGLGGDITPILNSAIQQRSGNASLALSDATNVVRGLGDLLGLVNQYSVTYNFGRDGVAIPIGNPVSRSFASNDYEFYVQDSFRVRRDLTLTYGLRYSLFGVPYEQNGVEVASTVGIDQYFAERVNASLSGVPGYKMPNASLTYALAGPANGKPGWYSLDKNNFAPRLALAYSPEDGLGAKLLGKGSVVRAGFALMYDHYGSDMIINLDSSGSPGLATSLTQPVNTNFTTATRYINGALPTLPSAPQAQFPYTPPTVLGGFGAYLSISPNLVAPYSYVMNAAYGRQLPGKMALEVGYLGRLGHKGLLQQDTFQPLTQFKDQASGQTWAQAATQLRLLADKGLTPAQVKADPSLAGKVPFIENMFPALANLYIPGSATANYFDTVYRQNAGSQLDALNQLDRGPSTQFPKCITATGCNTFYPLQNAGNRTWVNAGNSSFHAMIVTLRRQFSSGLSFDFNYTLSHSIDTSSAPESGAGSAGALIQDSFNPGAFRGASDFDSRHQINANLLYELPFGRHKAFLAQAPGWVNQIVGGWQVSMLSRFRTGLPSTITYNGLYPTNYLTSALAILKPGAGSPANSAGYDQTGTPSIFRSTTAATSFIEQYPGSTGTRGIVRLAGSTNFDIAVAKSFAMPWEGHRIQLRGEAFNAFNHVNFYNPNLSLASSSTFGEFQNAQPARVMQFALRYEF
jgi:hypothetical protein